jgi:uncharacterized protein with FMN-binding domain
MKHIDILEKLHYFKTMKFIMRIIVLLILTSMLAGCAAIKEAKETQITMSGIEGMDNGVYRGEYKINPVQVVVDVEIMNGNIKEIRIIEHICGLGKKAEKIIDEVVNSQSLQVDTVTGATVSSKVILKAIENALGQMGK